jgi:hypothetical protein
MQLDGLLSVGMVQAQLDGIEGPALWLQLEA